MIKKLSVERTISSAIDCFVKILFYASSPIRRQVDNLILLKRIHDRSLNLSAAPVNNFFTGLNECDVVYINLDERRDRRRHIERELESLGIRGARRIAAVKDSPGSLGCSKSHLLAYRSHHSSDPRMLLVCEDDISFVESRESIDRVLKDFHDDERIDILLLSYNSFNGVSLSNSLSLTSNVQTTACYAIKPCALPALVASAELSISLLSQGFPDKVAALDIVWKTIQTHMWFAVSSPVRAVQIESYSDIQNKICNYSVYRQWF